MVLILNTNPRDLAKYKQVTRSGKEKPPGRMRKESHKAENLRSRRTPRTSNDNHEVRDAHKHQRSDEGGQGAGTIIRQASGEEESENHSEKVAAQGSFMGGASSG